MNWIPSIVLIVLFSIIWFMRNVLRDWLTKKIQHKYDKKIEEIRTAQEKNKDELDDIRKGYLNDFFSKNSELRTRRLKAIDDIWKSLLTVKNETAAFINFISLFNFEEIKKRLNEPETTALLNNIANTFMNLNVTGNNKIKEAFQLAAITRPWISLFLWSIFETYSSIVTYSVASFFMLRSGIYDEKLIDKKKFYQIVCNIFPGITISEDELINNTAFPVLLNELEKRFLGEIELMLTERETNQHQQDEVKKLLELSQTLNQAKNTMTKEIRKK